MGRPDYDENRPDGWKRPDRITDSLTGFKLGISGFLHSGRQQSGRQLSLALIFLVVLAIAALVGSCSNDEESGPTTPGDPSPGARLLALGNSYTVGHAVPEGCSWPHQLADSLAVAGDSLEVLEVIAKTGWTSAALRDTVARHPFDAPYDLVMLQIGVNDQFTSRPRHLFTADLAALIDTALVLAAGDTGRVICLSIPDYGVTPVGQMLGADRISEDISRFNLAAEAVAVSRGVTYLDITDLSREAEHDRDLVARDGIHCSTEMYRRWVSRMLPAVRAVLSR